MMKGLTVPELTDRMHASILDGETEMAMSAVLEILNIDQYFSFMIVRQLLLFSSYQIGSANPSLILMIDDLISRDINTCDTNNILLAVEILCTSPKCDSFVTSCEVLKRPDVVLRADDDYTSLKASLVYIESYIEDGYFQAAVEEAGLIYYLHKNPRIALDEIVWNKLCALFAHPSMINKWNKISATFWLPLLSKAEHGTSQKVCDLVHRLYAIVHNNYKVKMRDDENNIVLWIHALWSLTHVKEVEDSWYADGKLKLLPNTKTMSVLDREIFITTYSLHNVKLT